MSKIQPHAPLTDAALEMVAARFRVLGEASRLRLLRALEAGERNVSTLLAETGLTQANASRHLQTLAEAGILARRREGQQVFYSIADPLIFELCALVCRGIGQRLQEQARVLAPLAPAAARAGRARR